MTFENQKQKLRKTNVYRLTRITNINQGSGFEIPGVYGGMGKSVSYLKFVLSFQEVRLHPQIKNIITGIFHSFGQENYIMMKRNYL